MTEIHTLTVSIAASLARLQVRLMDRRWMEAWPPNDPRRREESRWVVGDVQPPSPWLDAVAPNTALGGVIGRITLVQAHLLTMLEADTIDARRVCHVLHHLSGGGAWSDTVLRLASRLGVQLASHPMEELHGSSLHNAPLPGRWGPRE